MQGKARLHGTFVIRLGYKKLHLTKEKQNMHRIRQSTTITVNSTIPKCFLLCKNELGAAEDRELSSIHFREPTLLSLPPTHV